MQPKNFVAKRFSVRYAHLANATPEEVFPLLCPVRETEWIKGWSAEIIFSESGLAEDNCVFQASMHGRGQLTYMVTRYDRENFVIEFAIFSQGMTVEKLDLALKRTDDGKCEVNWTRTYTGLSIEGNVWAEHYVNQSFRPRMEELAESMNRYLKQRDPCEFRGKGIGK